MGENKIDYKNKWNNYTIGKIPWVNSRREHPSRVRFVEITKEVFAGSHKPSIIEIGAGECTEAIQLKDMSDYTVMDISDTFLDHAKANGLKTIKCDMITKPKIEKKFDVLYMCAVLEHTPDLIKTIRMIKSIANRYIITMFRWGYNGNIKPTYKTNRKCYSSTFDIDRIISMLDNILIATVKTEKGKTFEYYEYAKTVDKTKEHRNGNWLTLFGSSYK